MKNFLKLYSKIVNKGEIPPDLDLGLLAYLCLLHLQEEVPDPIKQALINRGYIKVGEEGVVLRDKANKLFQEESLPDEKFKEFYLAYPEGFGQRRFRTVEPEGLQYEALKEAYKRKIKTTAQHEEVMKALKKEVQSRTVTGEMKFMQLMKTYINQATWELWKTESKLKENNLLDEDL